MSPRKDIFTRVKQLETKVDKIAIRQKNEVSQEDLDANIDYLLYCVVQGDVKLSLNSEIFNFQEKDKIIIEEPKHG